MSRKSDLQKCLEALRGSGKMNTGNRCNTAIKKQESKRRPSHPLGGPLPFSHIYKAKELEILRTYERLKFMPDGAPNEIRLSVTQGWRILKTVGDPIADLAIALSESEIDLALYAGFHLSLALERRYHLENPPTLTEIVSRRFTHPTKEWFDSQRQWVEKEFRLIQKDILVRHIELAWKDRQGKKSGLLDSGTITRYHQDIFAKHKLEKSTFTGTFLLTDPSWWHNRILAWGVWCRRCDEFIPE